LLPFCKTYVSSGDGVTAARYNSNLVMLKESSFRFCRQ
jgi:hypothetical protein